MNNKIKKWTIRVLGLVIIFSIIICGTSIYSISVINKKSMGKIVNDKNLPKDADAIIVLGAGVDDNGVASDILVDRLETALEVYKNSASSKFLLSGDHGKIGYNEVGAMKDYIMDHENIKEENIFLDHAGFSTYETMYRAKEIFKVKKAIIVTNEYHLPRALYIADKMGIEAYGVNADKRNYIYIDNYKKRENLAKIKDFMYTNIIKPEPTFLGDAIPISTSDGRITDDEI
ncbi:MULTISPECIES: SanA/YdcF family protein [Clostridium]|uniref:ElyC/SanA/YdcF family protein n=1 Tax=Clostridium nitritogenes TaxID=83340 RepID=A0ABN1LKB2_9CLOT|nr:ElyC/SanA/YdcF family protein [Clostridium baratii]AQM60594.1 SanA protein [Clostridium baratii]KJU71232.1 SanA protein [Clostridium baratii]MBS6043624.1 YdcF family protein [Clostridium baratii]MDY3207525.1 ElyC/SanA/YdcF family protein [Clostridium baratii]